MSTIISHITEGSIASEIGLKKGDILIEVNGKPVRDVIDYMYYFSKGDIIDFIFHRSNKTYSCRVKRKEKIDIGFELRPFTIKSCKNKCIFCFVNQLPKDMRRSLYVKDDDYRLSFLYGNYITLTNLSTADKKRIFEQRLSPLYVSIHSTNNELRRKILGNSKSPDILKEIEELISHKIKIHAQIVLCPGLNDGKELLKTINDLQRFYPYIASIAIVPVGLTKYRKNHLKPVEKADAIKAIEIIKSFSRRFKKRYGNAIVYAADELYLKSGVPLPSSNEYGDFPQLENGVGMVSQFLKASKKLKISKKIEQKNIATFTGVSFISYLEEFSKRLKSIEGLSLDIFKVENNFFGPSVTVTGLLTGRDILRTIIGKTKADCLLVPDVTLRDRKDTFLDNVTLKDLEEALGMRVMPIESTPEGLLKGVLNECKWKN